MPATHKQHLTLSAIDPPPEPAAESVPVDPESAVGFSEACRYLGGISKSLLRQLVRDGEVKALQRCDGGRLYFRVRDLRAYLATLEH